VPALLVGENRLRTLTPILRRSRPRLAHARRIREKVGVLDGTTQILDEIGL